MDTSETYIKMSDKAKELWQFRKTELGDFLAIDRKVYVYPEKWSIDSIPLFRQDQLQRIGSDESIPDLPLGAVKLLMEWIYGNKHYALDFTSREQLELAYVMSDQYNKVWNGEDWIKEAK